MANTIVSFDDQQIVRIEQIVMDQDEQGAFEYIKELRRRIKRSQIGCDPVELKAREGMDHVIDKAKKHL